MYGLDEEGFSEGRLTIVFQEKEFNLLDEPVPSIHRAQQRVNFLGFAGNVVDEYGTTLAILEPDKA